MRVEILKPRVSAALTAAVSEIRGAGVEPTFDEIIWLHDLVKRSVLPSTSNTPDAIRYPFKVHGVWFYPLTVSAYIWFSDCAREWWKDDDVKLSNALAFAMAHSDGEGNIFPRLMQNSNLARARVRLWCINNLTFSRKTVMWATSQFYGDHETITVDGTGVAKNKDADNDEAIFEWGELTCFVAATYALDPERVQRMSINEVLGLAKRAPAPKGAIKPSDDPDKVRANAHLRLAIRHIIRGHKEKEDVS